MKKKLNISSQMKNDKKSSLNASNIVDEPRDFLDSNLQ